MPTDFIPSNDQEFKAWVLNYSALITLTPTAYGLIAGNATTLAGYVTTFTSSLTASTEPLTRGEHTILLKDQARATLESYCRATARQINGTMTVTNSQRDALGLTLRDVDPAPIGIPGQCSVAIKTVVGRTATAKISDPANPTKRGKPAGVGKIHVYSHIGETFPADLGDYRFQGAVGRTTVNVTFPADTPAGAKVWIVCAYANPRGEEGAPSVPQFTNLQGGSVQSA